MSSSKSSSSSSSLGKALVKNDCTNQNNALLNLSRTICNDETPKQNSGEPPKTSVPQEFADKYMAMCKRMEERKSTKYSEIAKQISNNVGDAVRAKTSEIPPHSSSETFINIGHSIRDPITYDVATQCCEEAWREQRMRKRAENVMKNDRKKISVVPLRVLLEKHADKMNVTKQSNNSKQSANDGKIQDSMKHEYANETRQQTNGQLNDQANERDHSIREAEEVARLRDEVTRVLKEINYCLLPNIAATTTNHTESSWYSEAPYEQNFEHYQGGNFTVEGKGEQIGSCLHHNTNIGFIPYNYGNSYPSVCLQGMENESTCREHEMSAKEYLDEFDRKSFGCRVLGRLACEPDTSKINVEAISIGLNFEIDDGYGEFELLPSAYTFDENNPYLLLDDAFERGVKALARGRVFDAILYFEAAIKQHPANLHGWILLGKCQAYNEDDWQAIAAYKEALTLEPKNVEVCLALAVAYTNESMGYEALEILENWITFYSDDVPVSPPSNSFSENPFEDLNIRAKKVEQLIREILAKQQLASDKAAIYHNALTVVYTITGDHEQAIEEMKFALVNDEEDFELWNRLGATYANARRLDKAIDAFRMAIDICPDYVRARYNLGCAYIEQYDYFEAIEHFMSALQLQQNCGSRLSSTIWSKFYSVVLRQLSSLVPGLLEAVIEKDLAKCIEVYRELLNVNSGTASTQP